MFDHEGPFFIVDEEDEWVIGQCSCGWETSCCASKKEAQQEFDNEHFFAGYEPDTPTYYRGSDKTCRFCGNEGHSDKECSRKPLLRI